MRTQVASIPRRPRDAAADAAEHPVVRTAAEAAQPPADVVVIVTVIVAVAHVRPGTVSVRPGPAVTRPLPVGAVRPAVPGWLLPGRDLRYLCRAATVGKRTRAGIGCLCDTPMIARHGHRGHQGHP